MREFIKINDAWLFIEHWNEQLISSLGAGVSVHLPHAMKEMPLHYGNEKDLWIISGYQRIISYHSSWKNKRIILRFEGVMVVGEIFINGQQVSVHKGGYTPWEMDITEYLIEGDNLLTVKVDSNERSEIPPFGAQIDYLCYNGIYREVSLHIVDPISIGELLISQKNSLTIPTLTGHIRIRNSNKLSQKKQIQLILKDQKNKQIFTTKISISLNSKEFQDIPIDIPLTETSISLWSLDNPTLYYIEATIDDDIVSRSIGFREAIFEKDGFYLNGEKIKLRGLNRHQSFPYIGYAMPARAQKKDADILKYELGLNLVRTSHYPQSSHFLDRCDEIGLLVFEEIPGWQHIGNTEWKNLSIAYVKEMIERDIHHPSIILWGVRINESTDDHDFYTKTNAIGHQTDPTRQLGGVRCISHSEFLEDVYTMNDFIQDHQREGLRGQKEVTGLDHYVPYLVTEYNGHMFPTKSWDNEERLIEHTDRHYKVLASAMSNNYISGCIGWCAFDYHTHFDFGAGDRICYHGVMDMFRIPKFAAGAYRSQSAHSPFLQAVTVWARGERSIGGTLPLMVSTNCDYIKVKYGKLSLGTFYPAEGRYIGLKHPPIIVEDRHMLSNVPSIAYDEWGQKWQDGTIEGYKNGKCVITQHLADAPLLHSLEIKSDDSTLIAPTNGETWDTTRITVIAKDQQGNTLHYINAPIQIDVTGGELIGSSLVSLEGGCYAFWVKALKKTNIIITVSCPIFKDQELIINIQ